MNRLILLLVPSALLLSGCISAHYRRPDVPVPPNYRGETAGASGSLGELRWQDLIRDERLNELIREALANNYDVRIAAARVLEAGARVGEARSQRWPSVDAQASYNNLRTAQNGSTPLPAGYPAESDFTKAFSALSWELDLWGRVRNANAAVRAELLATEEAGRVVLQTLVAQVAQSYFLLRDLDLEKEITDRSLKSRQESLELVQLRVENGYSSEIDLRQAEVLVKTVRAARTDLERRIEQTENLISFLVGAQFRRCDPRTLAARAGSDASTGIGAFLDPFGTPARHTPGRTGDHQHQCAGRRSQGSLLPAHLAHRVQRP